MAFILQLESGAKLQVHVYLCFDAPQAEGGEACGRGPALDAATSHYSW